MVYIFTLVALLYFICVYDMKGLNGTPTYNRMYKLTMLWFICVSGFAYNVGSDIPAYMTEYEHASWSNLMSLTEMLENNERRMPAWTLLVTLCHSIFANFVLLKFVTAAFCNWVFFRFIKKHSQYPFISVLLYAVMIYLHMNFNALRQMVSVAVFLYGYEYLTERKWMKYYLCVLIAYMFHSSALLCFILPLFSFLKITRKTIIILSSLIILASTFFYVSDVNGILQSFFFVYGGDMSADIQQAAITYLTDDAVSNLNVNGLILIFMYTLLYTGIAYFAEDFYRAGNLKIDMNFYIVFLIFYAMNFTLPIVFFRLLFYVQFFFICVSPTGIFVGLKRLHVTSSIAALMIIGLLAHVPIKQLFVENERVGVPLIVQYYPYYSVFNPVIDPVRNAIFGSHQ